MEQKWIDKLKNFEAQPPAGLWDRLESALDGAEQAPFARKLHDFEATPPPAAWDRIARQLEAAEPEVAPVVELKRRRSFAPYIAAAALIGILLVGASLLFNRPFNDNTGGQLARTDTPVRRTETPASESTGNEAAVAQPEAPVSVPDVAKSRVEKADAAAHTERNNRTAATRAIAPPRATDNAAVASVSNHPHHVDDERYLVRAYNDGSVVRFSKKVSPVVDCAENSSGFTQSLCRVSIGAVQDKVAAALTTDFGSLIERLQDLEKASR
ncbi:hypothetical protein EPD60_05050 [Flaviaesturariibacter flavus]|uniref:Uncharacterized protein n=1 Tax=Flaviaesturariibacter flavus TaxID=2502780 RepID=A0A4V2NWI9_9BACT|nr:hypothetical protein [Flaviaesturariibacter flavus]TCJ17562.1 hypothetical protein EPD60_05050 [Flaviaesturariibacter flavus]